MGRRAHIVRIEDHPNLAEILGILAQLAHIDDDHLHTLARTWRNTVGVAEARRRALSPDAPLIIDVLAAFDAVAALYADDLAGGFDYLELSPETVSIALKAVRDAIAAAYARPMLSRSEYSSLINAYRVVFPRPTVYEPDLGPAAVEVRRMLALLPTLADRCHDETGRRVYDGLLVHAMTVDEQDHAAAVEAAFSAAVRSGRRRIWTLVRRGAAESLGRFCVDCRTSTDGPYDDERVRDLCADAACALLVHDVLAAEHTSTLTAALRHLIPLQRAASESDLRR